MRTPPLGIPFTNETAPSTGRDVRSFKPRMGRMSTTKLHALNTLLPKYIVAAETDSDIAALFGRAGPLFLDIGFGMGDSTVSQALARPDANILAIDVHVPGHAMLAQALFEHELTNVRILACDAFEALMWMLGPASVTEVHLWFPDPWPKQSQRARRLVAPDFVDVVADRLVDGGVVRMATDWQNYADQMLRTLTACSALECSGSWAPRYATRPLTSFERKGIEAGRAIRDLAATRRPR